MKRGVRYAVVAISIVIAFVVQLPWPAGTPTLRARAELLPLTATHPRVQATDQTFLPIVMRPGGPPEFTINSPVDGSTIAGMLFFSIQPLDPASINSVTFRAGSTLVGTDDDGADGFRVFLDASSLPAGPLELAAAATGSGGSVTETIEVTVVSSPPSSATVGPGGGVLASEIGSDIRIPPGALAGEATISVDERTQEEITGETGFDWEAAGVTFLGAQAIASSGVISGALGVASAGFGNRVQPGQAIVNYRFYPDADGDGKDELVVVNTASVAPNNDVISDPVPQVLIRSSRQSGFARNSMTAQVDRLSGPPGTPIEIETTGLNPASPLGTIAIYRSSVDGQQLETEVFVKPDLDGDGVSTVVAVVPLFSPGQATLVLRNTATGYSSAPIQIEVEPVAPLTRPAIEIIDEVFAESINIFSQLSEAVAGEPLNALLPSIAHTISQTNETRAFFQELANDPTPEEAQLLNDLAAMLQGASVPSILPGLSVGQNVCASFSYLAAILTGTGLAANVFINLGRHVAADAALALVGSYMTGVGIAVLGFAAIAVLALALYCLTQARVANCPASPGGPVSGGARTLLSGAALIPAVQSPTQVGTVIITGMGSTMPVGGNGCGSAIPGSEVSGLAVHEAELRESLAGRYVIKIQSGAIASPFSGVSDAAGYFFVPLIPEHEPFTAVALDTRTGETRTFSGIGPKVGESTYLFFDFLTPADAPVAIEYGEVVSGSLDGAGDTDVYSFSGSGLVTVRLLDTGDTAFEPQFTLYGPDIEPICSNSDLQLVNWPCWLEEDGAHTLVVADRSGINTGNYRLYLERTDERVPDAAPLAYHEVMTGTTPLPPARAAYTLTTDGNSVLIRVLSLSSEPVGMDVDLRAREEQVWCGASGWWPVLDCYAGRSATKTLRVGTAAAEPQPFRLYVQRITNPPNATALAFGETVTETIALAPAVRAYTFTGSAGDEVVVTMEEVSGTIDVPELHLYRPDGGLLCAQVAHFNASSVEMPCTLDTESADQYTILAGDRRGAGAGRFTMRIERTGP